MIVEANKQKHQNDVHKYIYIYISSLIDTEYCNGMSEVWFSQVTIFIYYNRNKLGTSRQINSFLRGACCLCLEDSDGCWTLPSLNSLVQISEGRIYFFAHRPRIVGFKG